MLSTVADKKVLTKSPSITQRDQMKRNRPPMDGLEAKIQSRLSAPRLGKVGRVRLIVTLSGTVSYSFTLQYAQPPEWCVCPPKAFQVPDAKTELKRCLHFILDPTVCFQIPGPSALKQQAGHCLVESRPQHLTTTISDAEQRIMTEPVSWRYLSRW